MGSHLLRDSMNILDIQMTILLVPCNSRSFTTRGYVEDEAHVSLANVKVMAHPLARANLDREV